VEKNVREQVGYRHPPRAHQFKPGASGNPSGRPKKRNGLLADLSEELNRVSENGRPEKWTQQRLILRRLVALALGGDLRAIKMILEFSSGEILESENFAENEVPPDDFDALKQFAKRERSETGQ
jgi:hypothetical protein